MAISIVDVGLLRIASRNRNPVRPIILGIFLYAVAIFIVHIFLFVCLELLV
jgi:hypothetical protein